MDTMHTLESHITLPQNSDIIDYVAQIKKIGNCIKTKDTFLDTSMFGLFGYYHGKEISLSQKNIALQILQDNKENYSILKERTASVHAQLAELMNVSSVGISPAVAREMNGNGTRKHIEKVNLGHRARIQRLKHQRAQETHLSKDFFQIELYQKNLFLQGENSRKRIVKMNHAFLDEFSATLRKEYFFIKKELAHNYAYISKCKEKKIGYDDKIVYEIFQYATQMGRPINLLTRDEDFGAIIRKTFDKPLRIDAPTSFELHLYFFRRQKPENKLTLHYNHHSHILELKESVHA